MALIYLGTFFSYIFENAALNFVHSCLKEDATKFHPNRFIITRADEGAEI